MENRSTLTDLAQVLFENFGDKITSGYYLTGNIFLGKAYPAIFSYGEVNLMYAYPREFAAKNDILSIGIKSKGLQIENTKKPTLIISNTTILDQFKEYGKSKPSHTKIKNPSLDAIQEAFNYLNLPFEKPLHAENLNLF